MKTSLFFVRRFITRSTRFLSTDAPTVVTTKKPLVVTVFSSKPYDQEYLKKANENIGHKFKFREDSLSADTAVLANGSDAVCVFVNDTLDKECLTLLHKGGTKNVLLRCAGYDRGIFNM